jgi:hypothetical protein
MQGALPDVGSLHRQLPGHRAIAVRTMQGNDHLHIMTTVEREK